MSKSAAAWVLAVGASLMAFVVAFSGNRSAAELAMIGFMLGFVGLSGLVGYSLEALKSLPQRCELELRPNGTLATRVGSVLLRARSEVDSRTLTRLVHRRWSEDGRTYDHLTAETIEGQDVALTPVIRDGMLGDVPSELAAALRIECVDFYRPVGLPARVADEADEEVEIAAVASRGRTNAEE